MIAPVMGPGGQNGEQMDPKAPSGGQMAQAGVRDQADNVNECGTTSFFSYSDYP